MNKPYSYQIQISKNIQSNISHTGPNIDSQFRLGREDLIDIEATLFIQNVRFPKINSD